VIRNSALLTVTVLAVVLFPMGGCGGGDDTVAPTSGEDQRQAGGLTDESGGGEKSIEEFGREATGSERTSIKNAFTGYLEALADEDYQTACFYLASGVQQSLRQIIVKRLKDDGCARILPRVLSPSAPAFAREQAEGEIAKIRAEDDRGFVVFRAPGAKLHQMTMVSEGGDWKVANLGSSVLVPEL